MEKTNYMENKKTLESQKKALEKGKELSEEETEKIAGGTNVQGIDKAGENQKYFV